MQQPMFVWTSRKPSRAALRQAGFRILSWRRFRSLVTATRRGSTSRDSLANPAASWFATLVPGGAIAILGVPCADAAELHLLHGYLIEPAYRRRVDLLVHASFDLAALEPGRYVDREWRYPWTLERIQRLASLTSFRTRWPESDDPIPAQAPGVNPWRRLARLSWSRRDTVAVSDDATSPPCEPRPLRLDAEQAAAVRAGDGVVQVIAPAGSGKTSVLIERVKELRHRGVDAERILCASFNRDAKAEISARLEREGVAGITVRSFHGLGLEILRAEGHLRGGIGAPTPAQWRVLAQEARPSTPQGILLDPVAAQEVISCFKLAQLVDPAEALAAAATDHPRARTAARLYALYESLLISLALNDFDDLIMVAVRLLQQDAAVRRRWQARFSHVLVDEYQDIEPAQALLVGLLAAPEDALFCVGDEDQCIYAWRRATVTRVIELDQTYPGLERYPLVRNYRCAAVITDASKRLIEHNRRRFRKPLHAGTTVAGSLTVWPEPNRRAGAERAAALLADAERDHAAVLARTSLLLQEVALACAARGIEYRGSPKLSRPPLVLQVLEAILRLIAAPRQASGDDIAAGLAPWMPALTATEISGILTRRRTGARYATILPDVVADNPAVARLGALLDQLHGEPDAGRVVGRLRREGGLDRILARRERLDGIAAQAVEALAQAEIRAGDLTVPDFTATLAGQEALLAATRSAAGVELATIHAAKGREWNHVIIHGVDQGQFPHAQSLADSCGEAGLEDERRLFYVALTRARQRLDVICSVPIPSIFLAEIGAWRRKNLVEQPR